MVLDNLFRSLRSGFERVTDRRGSNQRYGIADLLSTAFAMFSLKDASLLEFRNEYPQRAENLKRIYGIEQAPGETALRQGLDGVSPEQIHELLKVPIDTLQTHDVFADRRVLGNFTVVSVDGTGIFSSSQNSCPNCMVKNHRGGTRTYYHQLLGAVWVHPDQPTVFPVSAEAIVKQDGSNKNDCELNAAKRLMPNVRKMLSNQQLLIVADALYANGPYIRLLQSLDMSFIIGIKEGFVLTEVKALKEHNGLSIHSWKNGKTQCTAHFASGIILNGQNQDIQVNFVEYCETDAASNETQFYSSWITDLRVSANNAQQIVAAARARWKIENEAFNTLKNQGYHLEHNYGHGKQNLATNFALLTLLAFLCDQVAQHLDTGFQSALNYCKSKRALWSKVRQVFDLIPAASMNAIHRFIYKKIKIEFPLLE